MKNYELTRFRLTLSTFAGIVTHASHWWCRIRWLDNNGVRQEAEPEHGRDYERTARFDSVAAARAAGLRLIRQIGKRDNIHYRVVTEGSAPGNLKVRANKLWREFEALDGWEAARDRWPEVEGICDQWDLLVGNDRWMVRKPDGAR